MEGTEKEDDTAPTTENGDSTAGAAVSDNAKSQNVAAKLATDVPLHSQSLIPVLILLFIMGIGGYLFGLYGWSVLWPLVLLVSISFIIKRRLQRFLTYRRHALERALVRQKLDRHIETVEWLNHVGERLWKVLEPFICVRVTEKVNSLLAAKCPSFLESIELREFTLGSTPPLILGARVYPQTSPDAIHLDAEICFIPNETDEDPRGKEEGPVWNSKVVLTARVGKGILAVDVPVMIKEVSFYGRIRVQLELAPSPPFLSKVQLSFLESPKIDFVLKPLKSLDVMDMPGLSSWLINTINGALSDVLVDPNIITIPLTRTYADVHSIGVLKVTLKQIRGIKFNENVLPHVRMQVGGLIKTQSGEVAKDTGEWNAVFYLLIHNLKTPLVFLVMQGHSVIGSVTYSIQDIEQDVGSATNNWRTIVGHESSKIHGELNFGVEYFPAMETPDPEADLNFESGIIQISIHQLKELVPEKERKSVNCCFEVFIHPSDETIDPLDPPSNLEHYYRSKPKKKSTSPSWDDAFDMFVDRKGRMSVTVVVRHALKEELILARWTEALTSLINRTDWFQFEDNERAQLFASFIFRPVRIDLSNAGQLTFTPSLGLLKVHLVSATNLKVFKAGYHLAVDVNGRSVGKSKCWLPTSTSSTPVWNKTITALVRDSKDKVHIEVHSGDAGPALGLVTISISELLAHSNQDIERTEPFREPHGLETGGRLHLTIGLYVPAKTKEETPSQVDAEDLTPKLLLPTSAPSSSNCGILEVQSIKVQGIQPTTIKSLHYATITLNREDPCYETPPAKITAADGLLEWRRPTELIIIEPQLTDMTFTVMETQGLREEFIDQLRIPMSEAHSSQWYKLEGMTQGSLLFEATYNPLPLLLEPDVNDSGVLHIQLISASELIGVDSNGTSDPFAVMRLNGVKFFRGHVIKKCLAPIFNERAEVNVRQRETAILQIELRDWNKVAASRTLGQVNIELQNLLPDEWHEMNMNLENVSSGKVRLKLMFSPEQTGKGSRRPSTSSRKATAEETINKSDTGEGQLASTPQKLSLAEIPEDEMLVKSTSENDSIPQAPAPHPPVPSITEAGGDEAKNRRKANESVLRGSTLTTATAAGLKIIIYELQLLEESNSGGDKKGSSNHGQSTEHGFDCRLKVRKGGQTIFKTRQIGARGTPRWNESFTVDTELIQARDRLSFVPIWNWGGSEGEGEFVLELGQLDLAPTQDPPQSGEAASERQVVLPLLGSSKVKAQLILKYALTMDTMNMVDHRPPRHRKLSFLGFTK